MKVITHPGQVAHLDEILACALILAHYPTLHIFRKEPTQADLDDVATWVVDVGMEYEPEKHNFDHHQLDVPEAAVTLVARYLECEEELASYPWWRRVNVSDTKGEEGVYALLGTKGGVCQALGSPIENFIRQKFAETDQIKPQSILGIILHDLGTELLRFARERGSEADELEKDVVFFGRDEELAVFSRCHKPTALRDWKKKHPHVVMNIIPSDRGPDAGWVMYVFKDHPEVKLSTFSLAKDPEFKFIHEEGFIAVTKPEITQLRAVSLALELLEAYHDYWEMQTDDTEEPTPPSNTPAEMTK